MGNLQRLFPFLKHPVFFFSLLKSCFYCLKVTKTSNAKSKGPSSWEPQTSRSWGGVPTAVLSMHCPASTPTSPAGVFSASCLLLLLLLRVRLFVHHTHFLLSAHSAERRPDGITIPSWLASCSPPAPLRSSCTGFSVPRPNVMAFTHTICNYSSKMFVGLSQQTVSSMRTGMLISFDPHVSPEPCSKSAHSWPSITVFKECRTSLPYVLLSSWQVQQVKRKKKLTPKIDLLYPRHQILY